MKFGLLKSKIETILVESYSDGTFKDTINDFKTYVLENKNISKLFYLYDELNSNKGINESIADSYLNECVTIYENVINKINPKSFRHLEMWVKDIKCENIYENIDNLFHTDILKIESKIVSRNILKENLKKKPKVVTNESVNLPLSTMLNVANKTIQNYIESLNESEKSELINFLKSDEEKLKTEFDGLKEGVKNKLQLMKENESNVEIKERITETLNKVSSERFDKFTYFKLKNLNENL